MRIKTSNNFYERTSQKRDVKSKHFFAYEGKTEEIYFNAIKRLFNNDVISISRTKVYQGWSNPKKLLEKLLDDIRNNGIKLERKSLEANLFEYYNQQDNQIKNADITRAFDLALNANNIMEREDICTENFEFILKYIDLKLSEKFIIKNPIDVGLIIEHIKDQYTYDESIDTISIVVDRDRNSFTDKDYISTVNKCKEANVNFYVTNPCFEFWLLLHFAPELTEEERCKLLLNKKESNKINYAHSMLMQYDKEYRKNKFNTNLYMNRVNVAINTSLLYETDVDKLIERLGSNLASCLKNLIPKDKLYK